jgi:predicted DNA-binding transcriptional regulator AlpA
VPSNDQVLTRVPEEFAGEDLLTVSEAADLTRVARSSMARWVREGRFPRATVLQLGTIRSAWYIPITDLIADGLVTRREARDVPLTRAGRLVVADLEKQVRKLTSELAASRSDVERLTLLTSEQAAIIADLRRRHTSRRHR